MQPDREDAERDDAAVEVAAHLFCEPFASAVCCRRCAQDLVSRGLLLRDGAAAAVHKSRLGVCGIWPNSSRSSNARERYATELRLPLRATLLVAALRRQKPRLPLALVSYRPLALRTLRLWQPFSGQLPPCDKFRAIAPITERRRDLCQAAVASRRREMAAPAPTP